LLDAGGLFGKRTLMEKEQSRFLCEVTSEFGYDAIGLGDEDLNYGIDFLREAIAEYSLPFTSANVFETATGELLLPEYLKIKRGGITFGICSVLDPDLPITTMGKTESPVEVRDPIATLRELIPRMRDDGIESIILFCHMGDKKTEAFLNQVAGVDICLAGNSRRPYSSERVVGKTCLISGSFEGRYMGQLKGDFEKSTGKLKAFEVDITKLDEKFIEEATMLARIEDFKVHLEEVRLNARGIYKPTKGSDKEQFLTSRECRKCHRSTWDTLMQSAHNSAYTTLSRKGQADEPECLSCHTTGYLYKGGYDEKPPANRLAHVQCEACHGYGTMHSRDGSMLERARKSCVVCHNNEDCSPDFDYDVYWEKIKH
jgi:hypothetical protein